MRTTARTKRYHRMRVVYATGTCATPVEHQTRSIRYGNAKQQLFGSRRHNDVYRRHANMRDTEIVVSSWKKCWYERLSEQSRVRYHQCRTRCKKRSRPAVHNCTQRWASGRRTRHKSENAKQGEKIFQLSRMIGTACPLHLNGLSFRQRTRNRGTFASETATSRRRGRRS